MKKIAAFLLALAMLLGCTGCYQQKTNENDTAETGKTSTALAEKKGADSGEEALSVEETPSLADQKQAAETTPEPTNTPEPTPTPTPEPEETSDSDSGTYNWMDYAQEHEALFYAELDAQAESFAEAIADDFDEVMSAYGLTYSNDYSRDTMYDLFMTVASDDEDNLYDRTADLDSATALFGLITGLETDDENYYEKMTMLETPARAFVNKVEIEAIIIALALTAYMEEDDESDLVPESLQLYSWFINTQYDEYEDSVYTKEELTDMLIEVSGLDLAI